jgi:hypothetical protein
MSPDGTMLAFNDPQANLSRGDEAAIGQLDRSHEGR